MPDRVQVPVPPFPFIVGSGRCGTTMLRAMFDSHPGVAIPREMYFPLVPPSDWTDREGRIRLGNAIEGLEHGAWFHKLQLAQGELWRTVARDDPRTYPDLLRCVYRTYAAGQGKDRYGNKTPMHVTAISRLSEMFPEARFIHVVRDGRNVALSYLERDFGPSDLPWAARAWRSRVLRGRRAGEELGSDRYRELRYEDLVDDPERSLRELCAFIDLPFDEGMLRYHERSPEAGMGRRVLRPPTKDVRDWRRQMSRAQMIAFESVAADALDAFGYPTAGRAPSGWDRVRSAGILGASRARRRLRDVRHGKLVRRPRHA